MTDRPSVASPGNGSATGSAPARRSLPRRPRFGPTILATVASFLVLFEFLAFQLRAGNDPALGAPSADVANAAARPELIHRKIIKRRLIHEPPRTQPVSASTALAAAASGSAPTAAVLAPAASAPAPAAAPAPASAAPVTSSS